jgi:hypothetical protein
VILIHGNTRKFLEMNELEYIGTIEQNYMITTGFRGLILSDIRLLHSGISKSRKANFIYLPGQGLSWYLLVL